MPSDRNVEPLRGLPDPLDEELEHYGILRKSGRYPWGTGKDPYQRGESFQKMVDEMRSKGLKDTEIAKALDLDSVTALRQNVTIARSQVRAGKAAFAMRLRDKGMSPTAIGQRMGINESAVRSLLDPAIAEKQKVLENVVNQLRDEVDKTGFLDIGAGVEKYMGVPRDKFNTAVAILVEGEDFKRYYLNQTTTIGNQTTVKVLGKPGTTYPELTENPTAIRAPGVFTNDGGHSFVSMQPPKAVAASRVQVVYGKDGGGERDGLIELRRGVADLDMGKSKYAQVRILVEGDRYLKGVAVISDDLPAGTDIRFNTPKEDTGNKLDAMKKVENDPTNPFGSSISRQNIVTAKDGSVSVGALNIVREEGAWSEWKTSLSSQFLSKQPVNLAAAQLKLLRESQQAQLDKLNALTNPTLKKELLKDFAETLDSDAVELHAMKLPRTQTKVLIPIASMKDTEVFAPQYKNGENVVLLRHPHGGIFELPSLTVNNNNPEAKRVLGNNPIDAIGINAKVAEQLSGADFDGDSVLVIPNNDGKVKVSRPIKSLIDFNPKVEYAGFDGMTPMTKTGTQTEMGKISNLITDMTIKNQNAPIEDIVSAIKHSMVVIDAEKHKLNYKQSEIDNRIAYLKKEYQDGGGASTLISRASAEKRVQQRKPATIDAGGPIDKKTGGLNYQPKAKSSFEIEKVNPKTGEVTRQTVIKTEKSTEMREAKDARSLMSSKTGTPMEVVYAEHANALKKMANQARLSMINTPELKKSPSAAKAYAEEVASLNAKLRVAQMNAPRERQAQIVAQAKANARIEATPGLPEEKKKKIRRQELSAARANMGARKEEVDITPSEWAAIQAGAIASTSLKTLLKNASSKQVLAYAAPREQASLQGPSLTRAASMLKSGYTQSEIAEALGVSVTTIQNFLKSS